MKKISLKFYVILFFALFLGSLYPLLIKNPFISKTFISCEKFNFQLSQYNTVNKCINYIDSLNHLVNNQSSFDTLLYVDRTSDFIKERFYHGLSNYSISDNWIAYLTGKLFWSHLSAIVKPDDILKHQEGLCSQQNIVFTEVLKSKGITSRAVGLGTKKGPGHFLTEVWYNNDWHLYDVDIEPNWKVANYKHLSLDSLLKNKSLLFEIYVKKLTTNHLHIISQSVIYGKSNEFPAKNMLLFHQITLLLTYMFPILFFSLFMINLFKNKRTSKKAKGTET